MSRPIIMTFDEVKLLMIEIGASVADAARNETQDSSRAALNAVSHVIDSFDYDWFEKRLKGEA